MELKTTVYRQIQLNHSDIVNCTEIDSYGRRLATCSSDKTIHIYDISKDSPILLKKLTGHEGPVWYCTWSDPSFGTYLATCSYDRKVIVWRENFTDWPIDYTHVIHTSSVTCVKWAPREHGLVLACGSHDGAVSIISKINQKWSYALITSVDQIGVTCLCWGPPYIYNDSKPLKSMHLAIGGVEGLISVYCFNEQWKRTELLNGEQDAVRSVDWTTSHNGNKHHIASAYNNGAVIIWSKNYQTDREWDSVLLKHFPHPVWHVSWTDVGNLLAISCGENQVSIWKRNLDDSWCCIKSIDEQ